MPSSSPPDPDQHPTPSGDADELRHQAIAAHRLGHLDTAAAHYHALLQLQPRHAEALHMLGLMELQAQRLAPALEWLDQAVAADPRRAAAHSDRGVLLQRLGRPGEALYCYEQAIALAPKQAAVHLNLGNALQALGRHDEAMSSFRHVLELQPGSSEANFNLGNCLQELQRHEAALACYEKALTLRPDHPEALNNQASSLRALGRLADALACCDAALRQRPAYPEALHNRAITLRELGRTQEAVAGFTRVLSVAPGYDFAEGTRLHLRLHDCDWQDYREQVALINLAVAAGRPADLPFAFLAVSDSPAAQLQCARTLVARRHPAVATPLPPRRAGQGGKIRLAYLSADFHEHPMAYLMAGLFEAHDRDRFELVAISFGPDSQGQARQRLAAAFDRFIDVRRQSDREVATLMHDMGIDIAIDRKGYTTGARPGILAWRPAPIQVNYLAYPGSMGAPYIDYLIADACVIPPEQQAHYSEKVVYLPDCYQANDDRRQIAASAPGRAELGLPERGFVFCCFNNNYKISPEVFDIWMRLLRAVDGSVLWLLQGSEAAVHNLRREASQRGVAAQRLVFAPPLPHSEHLARQARADLFLDTLPYNAHTTASDALWTGLPVLTRIGTSFAGRVAASLLQAVGMPELITHSTEDYENLALALASDPQRLSALRSRLLQNRGQHPLFDTRRFCRHIEAAYTAMWERHQRGEAPRGFSVLRMP